MTAARGVDAAIAKAAAAAGMRGRILVGYSGGLDSTVLLHAATEAVDKGRLVALHVNHGISPNADAWQRHCESVGARLGVAVMSRRVVLDSHANLEAAARRARYRTFAQLLGADDVLWLAHQLDDQAETVLWRLMRGGGAAAVAAMPASRPLGRGRLLRPMLDVAHRDIAAWARARALDWVDDDSNSDRRYTRNFVRHEVLPVLERRWPNAVHRLADAARRFAEETAVVRQTLDAQLDLLCAESCGLPLAAIRDEPARPLLRRWLEREGAGGVRERVLTEVLRQAHGASDRQPRIVVAEGLSVRRYAQRLYVVADRACDFAPVRWSLGTTLNLPGGQLRSVRAGGPGLRATLSSVEVRARRGGERMDPVGRAGSRSVKRLLQEADVPQWRRVGYPLLYAGDRLAAVPGIAIAAEFAETSQETWQLTLIASDGRPAT